MPKRKSKPVRKFSSSFDGLLIVDQEDCSLDNDLNSTSISKNVKRKKKKLELIFDEQVTNFIQNSLFFLNIFSKSIIIIMVVLIIKLTKLFTFLYSF